MLLTENAEVKLGESLAPANQLTPGVTHAASGFAMQYYCIFTKDLSSKALFDKAITQVQ